MAISLDAVATAVVESASVGVTTLTSNNHTVGSGASVLIVFLAISGQAVGTSAWAGHWDTAGTNQALTIVQETVDAGTNCYNVILACVNPTAGNKTLTVTWTGSNPAALDSISFFGSVSSSVALACKRAAGSSGIPGTQPSTLVLTGGGANRSICMGMLNSDTSSITGLTATSSTAIFTDTTNTKFSCEASRAPSAASLTWTMAPNAVGSWAMSGFDLVAALDMPWYPSVQPVMPPPDVVMPTLPRKIAALLTTPLSGATLKPPLQPTAVTDVVMPTLPPRGLVGILTAPPVNNPPTRVSVQPIMPPPDVTLPWAPQRGMTAILSPNNPPRRVSVQPIMPPPDVTLPWAPQRGMTAILSPNNPPIRVSVQPIMPPPDVTLPWAPQRGMTAILTAPPVNSPIGLGPPSLQIPPADVVMPTLPRQIAAILATVAAPSGPLKPPLQPTVVLDVVMPTLPQRGMVAILTAPPVNNPPGIMPAVLPAIADVVMPTLPRMIAALLATLAAPSGPLKPPLQPTVVLDVVMPTLPRLGMTAILSPNNPPTRLWVQPVMPPPDVVIPTIPQRVMTAILSPNNPPRRLWVQPIMPPLDVTIPTIPKLGTVAILTAPPVNNPPTRLWVQPIMPPADVTNFIIRKPGIAAILRLSQITGTLVLTTGAAVIIRPQVPPLQAGVPLSYPKGLLPIIPGGENAFAQKQFDQIRGTLSSVLLTLPQAATAPPTTLIDGMHRLARYPWRPIAGLGADAWVYWDAAGQVWRLGTSNPQNT